jgi:ASC-1-like (ASCH) protein
MEHCLQLHPLPFAQIKSGTKTIEVRLNDEKRQTIAVGDTIVFVSRADTEDRVRTMVAGLLHYPTFQALYAAHPPEIYGAIHADEYVRMYEYYTREDEVRYGVLGIQVRGV